MRVGELVLMVVSVGHRDETAKVQVLVVEDGKASILETGQII